MKRDADTDIRIKKLQQQSFRWELAGIVLFLGSAGSFITLLIVKTKHLEVALGMLMMAVLAAYGCMSYAQAADKEILQLKRKMNQHLLNNKQNKNQKS